MLVPLLLFFMVDINFLEEKVLKKDSNQKDNNLKKEPFLQVRSQLMKQLIAMYARNCRSRLLCLKR